jgi:Protein of unknown function (DUF1186)/SEC-C motif
MNVDQVLQQFRTGGDLPSDAMRWARDHWEQAAPRFIARLRAFAAGGDDSEAAEDEIFYILHLCGEKGETRAYEPLCRMIAEDPYLEEWLGDATTETLPGILIKVFDGDATPVTRAIEAPRGDEYARASALAAFGYLVRAKGFLDDEKMRLYLRRLRREAAPRGASVFWTIWAQIASALGYPDLRIDVAMLTKDGFIDPGDFSLEDFDEDVALAREDPDGLAGFRNERIGPLDDAVGTLESWSRTGEDADAETFDEEAEREDFDPEAPYVNPLRDVGRNDPCPCGSGRKYKKCCLGDGSFQASHE